MGGYIRREYPQWSWSFSRQQMLTACPRRYYYNYYGSHNGWEAAASNEAALAYRLKKLSNLYLVLGDALHKSAYDLVQRLKEGRKLPDADVVEEEIRHHLRRVWKSSRDERQSFLRRPNRVDMLHEFYYKRDVSEAVLERVNQRITEVSTALVASDVWEQLALEGAEIIASEQFDTFMIDQTPVYAVPDLLYKSATGEYRIVDWKTGEEVEDNQDQVALYALYTQRKYGARAEQITACLEYLSLGLQKELTFTTENLEDVEKHVRESVDKMRELLLDPAQNIAGSKERFPLTDEKALCPWCNFYELCQEQLNLSTS